MIHAASPAKGASRSRILTNEFYHQYPVPSDEEGLFSA